MFRRKLLEKQTEPDALDRLLVVVTPRSVMAVMALAGVLLVALVWSVVARIPVKVDGQGILMRPGLIAQLQATSEGRLITVLARPGDQVRAGDPVAVLSQPSLERQLDRLNGQYDVRRVFAQRQVELASNARALERGLAEERRVKLREQLESLGSLRQNAQEQRAIATSDRREKLTRIEALLERQRGEQQQRMEGVQELRERGVASNDFALTALTAVTSSAIEAARVELQISEIRLSEIDAVQEQLQLIRQTQEARDELTRIDISEQQAERSFGDLQREQQETVEEIAAQIRSARQELAAARRIDSPYDGVILELLAAEGALVGVGGPVAMMRLDPQSPFLRVVLSPDAGAGSLQISINGTTTTPIPHDADGATVAAALAELPALSGFDLVAEGTLSTGPVDVHLTDLEANGDTQLLVEIRDRDLWTADKRPATGSARILGVQAPERPLSHVGFFPIGLAKQIRVGMEMRIDPSSVARERFGSLVATVDKVADFAITEEGMLQVVGNSQVAAALTGVGGGVIMVEASLNTDQDDPSGYEWTSKSPAFEITEGTTTTARVVVEERRPISFVVPLLRRWLLGEGGTLTAAQAVQQGGLQ